MNTQKKILLLALALCGGYAAGQSRLYDRVAVDFPNDVNVAGKVLHAGSYEIRQLRNSASGARVLFITDKGGTGFEAEAATIPVLDNLTPTRTHVVLRRSGGMDYLRQVWIEGKNYGYEFTTPDQGQLSSAGSDSITLTATYTPVAPAVVAQNQPEPAREAAPAPAAPTPPPAPPAEPSQTQSAPPAAPAEQAQVQNAPPAPEPQQAQPQPAPTPAAPPASATEDAQRTTPPAPANRLPTTAMNWMAYLIAGILLLAAGALLNLFRVRSEG
jgi:hypothetical protein